MGIWDILAGLPTNAVQKKAIEDLEKENQALKHEVLELREKLAILKKTEEYKDLGPCSVKKNPSGGYFKTPLCPTCHRPMSQKGLRNEKLACVACVFVVSKEEVNAALRNA